VGYDVYDPNTSVAGNTTQEWTFGLNYFIKGDDLKLSLNYLLGDQPGDGLGYRGRLLARMQIVF
jgi:phosphate-selective porin OprO/OprP